MARKERDIPLVMCPVCTAHEDCFANEKQKCKSLTSTYDRGNGCPFYKPRDQWLEEVGGEKARRKIEIKVRT